jgi:hypothetical protein
LGDDDGRLAAGLVAVQQEDDMAESLRKKIHGSFNGLHSAADRGSTRGGIVRYTSVLVEDLNGGALILV